jgi:hypothetical protein
MPTLAGHSATTEDATLLGGGVVMLIASLLSWWSVSDGPYRVGVDGWDAGVTAWLPCLVGIAIGVAVGVRVVRATTLPGVGGFGPTGIMAAAALVSVVLIVIRWLTLPRYQFGLVGLHSGPGLGLYLGLVAMIAITVVAGRGALARRELPGSVQRKFGGRSPAS